MADIPTEDPVLEFATHFVNSFEEGPGSLVVDLAVNPWKSMTVKIIALILDGNSEIGAHVRRNLSFCYLFKAFD